MTEDLMSDEPRPKTGEETGICACPCHQGKAVHPVPCSCQPCLFCLRPIRPEAMKRHLEVCERIGRPA